MAEPPASPPRPRAESPTAQAPAPGRAASSSAPASPPASTSAAASAAARKTFLAPAAQLPSRLTYVAVAGPSGVKQCFRSVKTVRRIPTLPKKIPKDSDSDPSVDPDAETKAEEAGGASEPKRPRVERSSGSAGSSGGAGGGERGKRHACATCDKRFSSPGKLQQHQLAHTGELPFSCEFCEKRFNSKFKLVRHGLIHSEARAFSCPVCAKTFNRKDHLNNHVRVHNPVKKVHRCERPGCRKQYTSLLSYRKHAALHSAEEGNLQCKICSKTFEDRADIVYHLKVHTGSRSVKNETDKKFPCSFCDRKFFTGKDVRRHLVVHTGRRDFLCQFCPQKFGRKDHLVRHMKNAHPDEAWSSATAGTSSAPDVPIEEPSTPLVEFKTEPTPEEGITYLEYLEDLFEAGRAGEEAALSSGGDSRSRTPMPEPDVLEVPEEVKLEPLEVEPSEVELGYERELSPVPSTSRDVLAGNLTRSIEYPMYMIPPSRPYPMLELPELIDPGVEMLMEQGAGEEGLSSEIIDLIQSGRILSPEHPTSQQTSLPTFTQAFQSTAPSPKPPPPPPHQ